MPTFSGYNTTSCIHFAKTERNEFCQYGGANTKLLSIITSKNANNKNA